MKGKTRGSGLGDFHSGRKHDLSDSYYGGLTETLGALERENLWTPGLQGALNFNF